MATRASKTAEATLKQMAALELQVEKDRMEEWKENVMQEVAREVQVIKLALEKTWDAQKRGLNLELDTVREKIQQVESKTRELEEEIKSSKAQKQTAKQGPAQNTTVAEKALPVPSSSKSTEVEKEVNPSRNRYAQIATSHKAKSASANAWIEVTSSNRKRKDAQPSPPKLEPEKRRVIFRRRADSPQKLEADLMLVLNEALQKIGVQS